MSSKPRIAWILTHRIQYFVNLLDELHRRNNVDVMAIYAHQTQSFRDSGFGLNIKWDNRDDTAFTEILLPDSSRRVIGPFLNSRSRNLYQVLDHWQPNFLYLNGYTDAICIQAWRWAVNNGIPFSIRCDGDTFKQRSPLKAKVRRSLVSLITRDAYRVTYQGRENRKFWVDNGSNDDQLLWVPCVSDSQVFRVKAFLTETDRQEFRRTNNVGINDIVFVVSGKLSPTKRPKDAIYAIAKCKDLPLKLWFLGSGELETELKNLASKLDVSEKILWWGFHNQSECPKILQAADVLLHPSQADPWPYSILDGAISRLALLLSNKTGSYPDWMAPPAAGITFTCGDIDNLSQCLEMLVSDREKLKFYQESAYNRSNDYTEVVFCQIFEDMVASAVKNHSNF